MKKSLEGLSGLNKPLEVDLTGMAEPEISWNALASSLASLQSPEERAFRENLAAGQGDNSPMATLRIFDAPKGTEPRVTFYRDSASWCPYCQKVWLVLEEKRIPYKVKH